MPFSMQYFTICSAELHSIVGSFSCLHSALYVLAIQFTAQTASADYCDDIILISLFFKLAIFCVKGQGKKWMPFANWNRLKWICTCGKRVIFFWVHRTWNDCDLDKVEVSAKKIRKFNRLINKEVAMSEQKLTVNNFAIFNGWCNLLNGTELIWFLERFRSWICLFRLGWGCCRIR